MKPTAFFFSLCARVSRIGTRLKTVRQPLRQVALALTVLLALGLVALVPGTAVETLEAGLAADEVPAGWGAEALYTLQDHAVALSPVALANACGLGASSCFRCHNGKRAVAPQTQADIAPWHQQHGKVNYSCVGCHQGNPRILKADIAHKGLIANPVSAPEKTCASCHGADSDRLAAIYRKTHPQLIQGK